MKVLCLTALYLRPEVAEICFMGLRRLRRRYDIQPLAVYSGDFADLCRKYDVIGIDHENLPLGRKWNAGLEVALRYDWDYLMTVGSDDLISEELMELYGWTDDAFGINKCYVYDLPTGRSAIFENTYPIGLARCISRAAIEDLGNKVHLRFTRSVSGPDGSFPIRHETWTGASVAHRHRFVAEVIGERSETPRLWKDSLNQGLDFSSDMILRNHGIEQKLYQSDRPLAVDLKSSVNIWPFSHYREVSDDALYFLSNEERDAIRRLRS